MHAGLIGTVGDRVAGVGGDPGIGRRPWSGRMVERDEVGPPKTQSIKDLPLLNMDPCTPVQLVKAVAPIAYPHGNAIWRLPKSVEVLPRPNASWPGMIKSRHPEVAGAYRHLCDEGPGAQSALNVQGSIWAAGVTVTARTRMQIRLFPKRSPGQHAGRLQ